MLRTFLVFVLVWFTGSAAFADVQEQPRIALIIGNSNYQTSGWNLANPANDAALMARSLERIGFEVHTVLDANENAMETAFKNHGERLAAAGPDAIGFFFYAGHGVQSEGLNYLIPTDIEAYSEADVWGAPRLATLFRHLRRAGNDTNIIVLDACRNNPLLSSSRDISGGLAGVARDEARGMLVAYATAPGAVAADGDVNSPYTTALSEAISEPALPVETLFRIVATRVEARTEGRQRPWTESGLIGEDDFCFAGCAEAELLAGDEATALGQALASGSIERLQEFKIRFPQSDALRLVDSRIATLRGESASQLPSDLTLTITRIECVIADDEGPTNTVDMRKIYVAARRTGETAAAEAEELYHWKGASMHFDTGDEREIGQSTLLHFEVDDERTILMSAEFVDRDIIGANEVGGFTDRIFPVDRLGQEQSFDVNSQDFSFKVYYRFDEAS